MISGNSSSQIQGHTLKVKVEVLVESIVWVGPKIISPQRIRNRLLRNESRIFSTCD